jgi:hypothetical protein
MSGGWAAVTAIIPMIVCMYPQPTYRGRKLPQTEFNDLGWSSGKPLFEFVKFITHLKMECVNIFMVSMLITIIQIIAQLPKET